jgi:putative transposase
LPGLTDDGFRWRSTIIRRWLIGLTDRSRRPYRHANQLPFQIEKRIIAMKQERPSWGAPKIREKLRRLYPEVQCPAISTVHAVLDRHNLVKRRRRRRYRAEGTPLSRPLEPNDLWCADYKGEFMLADKRYCYPLTVTDSASRYLLGCEALTTTQGLFAREVFERIFKEFGLPRAIRTDNGVPFASPNALFGLSRLSIWWHASASRSNGSSPVVPSRTAVTNACTSP